MTKAIVLIAACLLLGARDPAWAGAPTDTLRDYTEAVQKVLDDPALKAEDRRHERRAAVRRLAAEAFDVQETARRALGPHWQLRNAVGREEFVKLFAELLERTYISQIDLYGGERLRFTEERVDGDIAVVRARVVTRQGAEVPLEGRMHKRGERWLIYDVVIENISLIANYRAQFDRIIRTSSYAELLKRLRNRSEFLQDKERRAGRA
jgi:phospholipid transport system substrate-binding protein